jgi:hypothetical protein
MSKQFSETAKQLTASAEETLLTIEQRLNSLVAPTRRTVFERFPIVFALLTTFGVVLTFLGMELIVADWVWFYDRPWLVMAAGIGILIFTGSLYKKLG